MTERDERGIAVIKIAAWYSVLGMVFLVGCSRPHEPNAPSATAINVAIDPNPNATPAKRSGFDYPADLSGDAVAKAVAPDRPALSTVRYVPTPKPRKRPAFITDPHTSSIGFASLPPSRLPHVTTLRPAPPRERVPVMMGRGADDTPLLPRFPIAAGITERARDSNLPPAMPILGRPRADRVSHEDPTADIANSVIIAPRVKVPIAPAPSAKATVPNPFELAEQVKPDIAPAEEPGLSPVEVNPERRK